MSANELEPRSVDPAANSKTLHARMPSCSDVGDVLNLSNFDAQRIAAKSGSSSAGTNLSCEIGSFGL